MASFLTYYKQWQPCSRE